MTSTPATLIALALLASPALATGPKAPETCQPSEKRECPPPVTPPVEPPPVVVVPEAPPAAPQALPNGATVILDRQGVELVHRTLSEWLESLA